MLFTSIVPFAQKIVKGNKFFLDFLFCKLYIRFSCQFPVFTHVLNKLILYFYRDVVKKKAFPTSIFSTIARFPFILIPIWFRVRWHWVIIRFRIINYHWFTIKFRIFKMVCGFFKIHDSKEKLFVFFIYSRSSANDLLKGCHRINCLIKNN